MPTNTVRLHRVLRAPPARTYRAFLEPEAIAKWLPPHGFTCRVQQMDARVGGSFRMSFTNFSTGSQPLLWRQLPRVGPLRAHQLYGALR